MNEGGNLLSVKSKVIPKNKSIATILSKEIPAWVNSLPVSQSIQEPISYFRGFFDVELLSYVVEQSNLYALQTDPNKPLNLSQMELEQFLGTVMQMSLIKLPRARYYWASGTSIPQVCQVFSRDRWEEIKSKLHFSDNSKMPQRGEDNFDKLYKLRPVLDYLCIKFNSIPMDQMLCINEQIVPFKRVSGLKRYIPKKPHDKLGYKIFVLSDTKGIVYNFEIYTGKIPPPPGMPDLEDGSNIVLHLSNIIPSGKNYLLYFDSWFTSLSLLSELAKQQIFCLGAIKPERIPGCSFTSDKKMKKNGKGTFEEKEVIVEGENIKLLKWFDNHSVLLASTFASGEPVGSVKRWDKIRQSKIDVPCPSMVLLYNNFMGGVDLLESLIALYRISLHSKKYYHRLFFYFLDLTVVTSWLLYRRDCESYGVPKKRQHNLFEFKNLIAEALCKEGKGMFTQRREGPSGLSVEMQYQQKRKASHATRAIPQKNIRTDEIGHWPITDEKRGRCKLPNCKGCPVTKCVKCKVHLCLDKRKNCFVNFHTS